VCADTTDVRRRSRSAAAAPPLRRRARGAATRDLRIGTATLGNQRVRYAVGGHADAARTLLLFNGFGANVESVAAFMSHFKRTRVVAFDAPGVGESPAPQLPYRPHHVARLAEQLLDHLQVERADVLGVSWGGAAAQEFAIQHPQRCRTLTLAATSAGFVLVPGRPHGLLDMFSPSLGLDPALVPGLHRHPMHGCSPLGWLYQLLAIWGWTSWHRLHHVKAPTLLLMGEDDPIVAPINGRIVASCLRNAVFESVDCGHLFVFKRAGETARRVERFVDHPVA
jgi:poly(3-hydroxyoctanoate) depolymerase